MDWPSLRGRVNSSPFGVPAGCISAPAPRRPFRLVAARPTGRRNGVKETLSRCVTSVYCRLPPRCFQSEAVNGLKELRDERRGGRKREEIPSPRRQPGRSRLLRRRRVGSEKGHRLLQREGGRSPAQVRRYCQRERWWRAPARSRGDG